MDSKIYITNSNTETEKVGEELAKSLKGSTLLLLTGNLGSGKTTFVKGLAKGLGIEKNISSPTFILLRTYKAPNKTVLNHIDLYRLDKIDFNNFGLEDLIMNNNSITVIEWAEKLNISFSKLDKLLQIMPINFKYLNENQREITIHG